MTRRTYIIAEAGVNHNGSLDHAMRLIDLAVDCGADAVKFQLFVPELLVTASAKTAEYQANNLADHRVSQREMLRSLTLPEGAMATLSRACQQRGIDFLCTPFDLQSLRELLATTTMRYLKLASGEVTHAPLLLAAAQSGLPVILSTGMSSLDEINTALSILHHGIKRASGYPDPSATLRPDTLSALAEHVVLLHCVSQYPAPHPSLNLRAIETLSKAYGLPVGYSDHSMGIMAPVAAVAMGACMIEKHLTYDTSAHGPDHKASLDAATFRQMVEAIRNTEMALGDGTKQCQPQEEDTRQIARRSIVAAAPIRRGELFSADNLVCKRPAGGISPNDYWSLLGKASQHDYEADTPLTPDESAR